VKVVGFVNSADGFNQQPQVINGASELLGQIFGEAGAHARSAVGVNQLPMDATCEVELIVKLK
jgi:enamine deaminase RidA (YjgF/YER057c/UK114 family)